jgi:hypothetical protein
MDFNVPKFNIIRQETRKKTEKEIAYVKRNIIKTAEK